MQSRLGAEPSISRGANRNARRRRLLLSTATLFGALFGYGRNAHADCALVSGSTTDFVCSNANADTQTINASDATVTTETGFSVETNDGNAVEITGLGAISFTDYYGSPLKAANNALVILSNGDIGGRNDGSVTVVTDGKLEGGNNGIVASNLGSEDLTITANGNVTGSNGDGINAKNDGTSLNVTTGIGTDVEGSEDGIDARNYGSGGITIKAYGSVEGTDDDSIYAKNSSNGTSLDITTGTYTVEGGDDGIDARNYGSGGLTIEANGNVKGTIRDGIYAKNYVSSLTVTTGAGTKVEGGEHGINARNTGSEGLTIEANGDVKGTSRDGIRARNGTSSNPTGTSINITTVAGTTVEGGSNGIDARNFGRASLAVTANGNVKGTISNGIYARNASRGTSLEITTGADSTVEGGLRGIDARNFGSEALTIKAYGKVYGSGSGTGIYAKNYGSSLTVTTGAGSKVEGGEHGINARNSGSEGLTIEANGDVKGTSRDGIRAGNGTSSNPTGTSINITTVAGTTVEGGSNGIDARNFGSAGLTIKAYGNVEGTNRDGIYARNSSGGTSLEITTGADSTVEGGLRGIDARNFGSEALTIKAYGNVYGTTYYGIYAKNYGTSVEVTTGADTIVEGGLRGIDARNYGSAGLTIEAYGNVKGTSDDGIYAKNYGTSLEVTTGTYTVEGGEDGIDARNFGSGGLTIQANGDVEGTSSAGIRASNGTSLYPTGTGTSINITTAADTTVTGGERGIIARNFGRGGLTIKAYGNVYGKSDDGILAVNFGTGLNITTGVGTKIEGFDHGIHAVNYGSAGITITAYGNVYGVHDIGIHARNSSNGTSIDITTGANTTVGGTRNGIAADNNGSADLTLKAYGNVEGTRGNGIFASNSSNGKSLNITTGPGTKVEGGANGIFAENEGSEGLTATAYGSVKGIGGDGIYAKNYGTSLNVTTGAGTAVEGGEDGVNARNYGSGGLTIKAYGDVYGGYFSGILARNGTAFNPGGTSVSITTAADTTVKGGDDGIFARNFGSEGLTINAYGKVYGTGNDGIYAKNYGTSLDITTGADSKVEGGRSGIHAQNYGTGATTITSNGDVTGTSIAGILGSNSADGTSLTITTATGTKVEGGFLGIFAVNNGSEGLTIAANGYVYGGISSDGIYAKNYGTSVNITTGADTKVEGGRFGIFARNYGSEGLHITANGDVKGTNGDGIYARHGVRGPIAITVGATGTVTSNGTDADDFAIDTSGGPSDVTVAGTLNGGAGGAVHLDDFEDRFELHTTGVVNGNVRAEGGTDTLAFGGTGDGAFNLDDIDTGANTEQYQGFDLFEVESGDWRFSGGTTAAFTVNGGTVGGNPTFGGLDILGGTLAPGNSFGTVTMDGDFAMAANSVLEIEVDASGLNDNVVVMGSVDIDDTTLQILTEIGAYAPSTDYTIIDNDGTDAITGSFAVITSSLAFLDPTVIYDGGDGNDVVLNLQRNATFFQDLALTRNQRQVASVLDQLPTDNLVLLAVANQTEAGAREAFNALLGEIYLNLETTTLFASQAFSGDLFSCPAYGEGSAAIAEGQCAWLRPQGGMRSFDGTVENIGFEQRWGGFSTGIQTELTPSWYANLAFGYQQGRLDTDTRAQGLSDTYQAGLSIKYQEGPWLFGAALSGGVADHETERQIAIGSFSTVARSDHQIGFVTGQLRAAYEAEFGAFYARPSIDAWLTYLNRDGFTETGGGTANLSVAGSDGSYFSVSPGIELGGSFATGDNTTIRPFVKAGFTYFANNEHALTSQFVSAPSGIAAFSTTSSFDDLFADVEIGVEMLRLDEASLSFGYQGKIAEDSAQHSGYVKGGVRF